MKIKLGCAKECYMSIYTIDVVSDLSDLREPEISKDQSYRQMI